MPKSRKVSTPLPSFVSQDPPTNYHFSATEKISENLHIIANEPSLAFYRIQEHTRKVTPQIIERRTDVVRLQQDLQGKIYDLEYAISAVKCIEPADQSLRNVQELLKNAIFLKQQLKYEETRRIKKDSSNSSVYKRLSAHITLDLPDIDISGVVRETTNRMSQMTQARSTTGSTEQLQRSYTTLH
jgi:BLOC-1 related complex subunit 8